MRYKEYYSEDEKQMASFAKALAHPARILILKKLSGASCCYSGNIAEELPIARSTLSQHLKELKEAGLIQGEIESPRIKYCINRSNWIVAKKMFGDLFDGTE